MHCFWVNTWHRTENTRAMCMFVSPVLALSSTNHWVDSFATYAYSCCICLLEFFYCHRMIIHDFSKQIKQSTPIGKIFARWHLVIAITSKKIDIIQCITHYTNTLTKWKVTCKMAWDIGLVLFEHFYVHVKVHKDAKKKEWDQYPATLLKQAWSVIGGKTEHVILHKQSPQSFLLGYS